MAANSRNLALLYQAQSRWTEAEPLFKAAVSIGEKKALGPRHPSVAVSLCDLASFYWEQAHYAEVEPLVDRAMDILQHTGMRPEILLKCYHLRAQVGWQAKRRGEAIADLRRAMDLAEQLRGLSSGAAHDRAGVLRSIRGASSSKWWPTRRN